MKKAELVLVQAIALVFLCSNGLCSNGAGQGTTSTNEGKVISPDASTKESRDLKDREIQQVPPSKSARARGAPLSPDSNAPSRLMPGSSGAGDLSSATEMAWSASDTTAAVESREQMERERLQVLARMRRRSEGAAAPSPIPFSGDPAPESPSEATFENGMRPGPSIYDGSFLREAALPAAPAGNLEPRSASKRRPLP